MKRVISYLAIGTILVLAGAEVWWHHTRSVAAQFMPRTSKRYVVPAGTQIQCVLKNLITSTTQLGDEALAFATDPITIDGGTVIPVGARLNGVVQQITKSKSKAVTWVRFNSLLIDEKPLRIETDVVVASAPITSDFEILGNAADALTEAGVGAAMGAATRNPASINAGVTAGALRGAAGVQEGDTKITVVLAQPVEVIR